MTARCACLSISFRARRKNRYSPRRQGGRPNPQSDASKRPPQNGMAIPARWITPGAAPQSRPSASRVVHASNAQGVCRGGARDPTVGTTPREDDSSRPRARRNVPEVPPEQGIADAGPESIGGSRIRRPRTPRFEGGRRIHRLGVACGRRILRFAVLGLRQDLIGHGFVRLRCGVRLGDEDSGKPDGGAKVGRRGGGRRSHSRRIGRADFAGQDQRVERDRHEHGGQEGPAAPLAAGINARRSGPYRRHRMSFVPGKSARTSSATYRSPPPPSTRFDSRGSAERCPSDCCGWKGPTERRPSDRRGRRGRRSVVRANRRGRRDRRSAVRATRRDKGAGLSSPPRRTSP